MGWTLKGVEILFRAVFSRFAPDRCVADDIRKPRGGADVRVKLWDRKCTN